MNLVIGHIPESDLGSGAIDTIDYVPWIGNNAQNSHPGCAVANSTITIGARELFPILVT